jgi:hypothetical protein
MGPRFQWAEYHENLVRKYESAAGHPWQIVAADPPEPEIFPRSTYLE